MPPLFLLLTLAHAEAPRRSADLHLGDEALIAHGGTWQTPTADVRFEQGFAFQVLSGTEPMGFVFVGEATHALHPGDGEAALRAALERELGRAAAWDGAGDWAVPVSVVWGLGPAATLPSGWEQVGFGPDAPRTASLLVVDEDALRAARRRAVDTLHDRPLDLKAAGYPLAATLEVGPDPGWSLVEARTALPLGGLAGRAGASEDPWITTLVDDVALDGGRRAATVALGARFVEKLTGV